MAHTRRSAHLNVMVEAAEKAARGLLRDFGEVEQLQVSKKGPGNFVSTADHKAEKTIRGVLEKARPKFGFLMEESGEQAGEDKSTRWIVDPLDGTSNFLHGIPHWSISIALEKDKEIIAAVVYDPVKDEMFWAEKGLGAYLNNRRLQVAGRGGLQDSMIFACATTLKKIEGGSAISGLNTRILGSLCLDLAYVAAGRLDALSKIQKMGGPWDIAAGSLLVKEARGKVTDIEGGKNYVYGKSIVAANAPIHADLMERLKGEAKKTKAAS